MKTFIRKWIPSPALQIFRRIKVTRFLTSSRQAADAIGVVSARWRERIDDVLVCPDNEKIPRSPDAGKLSGYRIAMHNGVKVCANGYYGSGILNLLMENKGVHEPQEEYAFETIIRLLPQRCTMLELGAYWGYYSLSLLKARPMSRCFLVEPNFANLISGKINFRINNRQGHFTQAAVDSQPRKHPTTISVDAYCSEFGIDHLDILHADIQGYEVSMLEGANRMLSGGKVDYIFISTHSNELHAVCIEKLVSYEYVILAEADLDETFSCDGLIVARHRSLDRPQALDISRKSDLTNEYAV